MTEHTINDEYFQWMYHLVCDEQYTKNLSYSKLLSYLHSIEFTYILDMDENRACDGIAFRYQFGYENGYSTKTIERYLDTKPCSVLEMMVALAYRCENSIMDDDRYGNRIGQWFWAMVVSLGLGSMDNSKFDSRYVEERILIFLNREYDRNGKGGLFTIEGIDKDMRKVEIWNQLMWYLNDILED